MIPPIRTTEAEEISYLKQLLGQTLPFLTAAGHRYLPDQIREAIDAPAPRPR